MQEFTTQELKRELRKREEEEIKKKMEKFPE